LGVAGRVSDRRFYLFMTLFVGALAVVGFAPSSAGILSGAIPTPPLVVHLHAAAMLSWLLLLITQAGLVSAGRRDLHMRLGLLAFALAAVILVLAAITTVVGYYRGVQAGVGPLVANVLFLQLRFLIMWPILIIWALAARSRDVETHKRVMIVATVMPLGAAFGRMGFIPGNNLLMTNDIASALEFVALAPALAYDLLRFGRVHRAYVIGVGVALAWAVATHFVWNAPWWRIVADALMNVP
jgi:hypothetical protein